MSCQMCRFLSSTLQAIIVTACLLIAAIYSFMATFHVFKALDHNSTSCANFTFFIVRSPECNPSRLHHNDTNSTTTISPELEDVLNSLNSTTLLSENVEIVDNVIPLDPLLMHVDQYAPNSLKEKVHEWVYSAAICYIALLHFCGGLLIILRRSKGLTIIIFGYVAFVTAIVLATVINQIANGEHIDVVKGFDKILAFGWPVLSIPLMIFILCIVLYCIWLNEYDRESAIWEPKHRHPYSYE